jgi:hypothetical protein
MLDAHFSPNLNCLAVLDRDCRQVDATMHVASLIAADTPAFADTKNHSVTLNLHDLDDDRMEVNGDEVAKV